MLKLATRTATALALLPLASAAPAQTAATDYRARLPQDEAVRSAERSPERFSPNVLLRPLVQDTLFPSICYVAGPNELAYLGQLKQIYAAFDVPMPLMRPRATATLLDANAVRFLGKHGLEFASLREQNDKVLNALLAAQLPPSVDASIAAATDAVAQHMTHVATEVTRVDPTLDATARSMLSRMQDDLKKLHGKVVQAAKRKDDTIRRQFAHAQAQAFPAGEPQERAVGMVYFLNKYGPGLVDILRAELPLDMDRHWLITV